MIESKDATGRPDSCENRDSRTMDDSHRVALVDRLRSLPTETEWLEFKSSRCSPAQLGEYLSALATPRA